MCICRLPWLTADSLCVTREVKMAQADIVSTFVELLDVTFVQLIGLAAEASTICTVAGRQ